MSDGLGFRYSGKPSCAPDITIDQIQTDAGSVSDPLLFLF
jgi:hypothetical protein